MTVFGSHSTPDAPGLPGGQRILETFDNERTAGADLTSSAGRFAPDFRIWNIFREEDLWKALAGYTANGIDAQQKLAVWMSGVEHTLKDRG